MGSLKRKLKQIVKLLLPPIVLGSFKLIKNFIKNPFNRNSTIHKMRKNTSRIIVCANGPSLNKDYELYKKAVKNNDCIVVNFFCNSILYDQIKPKFYLFMDPSFFSPLNSLPRNIRGQVDKCINDLVEKTSWKLDLILPSNARKSEFVEALKQNDNISIYYLNVLDMIQGVSGNTKFLLYDKNLLLPPAQTVINTAIYIGLFLEYQEVYLIGADSNFFQNLEVDQCTNTMYVIDEHFYGKEKRVSYKDVSKNLLYSYSEYVSFYARMFLLYQELEEYSKYKGIKVYNSSSFSMIDAFERKKLE